MEKNRKKHLLVLFSILFLGLILRVFVLAGSLNFPNNTDFNRYEDWARISHIYNFLDTYSLTHLSVSKLHPNNQPPGTLYIVSAMYESYAFTGKAIAKITHTQPGSILWVNTTLQHIFLKMAQILADFGLGLIAYFLVKEKNPKGALVAMALIIFNPIIIYNSTAWGQMDSLNNLLFLLSILFAFRKHFTLSILSIFASLFVKFSLLPLLPFYFVFLYYLSGKNWKTILATIAAGFIAIILATIPISKNSIMWLFKEIPIILKGEVNLITNGAFNFWWAVTCIPGICKNGLTIINAKTFFQVSLNIWGYVLFTVVCLPLLYIQFKNTKKIVNINVFLIFSLVLFAVFLFLPSMHERYLYPLFPVFAVFIGFIKPRKIFTIIYIALSLLNFGNLIYAWYPTKFPNLFYYQVIYSPLFAWLISVLLVILFVFLYIKSLSIFKQKFF